MPVSDLSGRLAFVTGGASGIGLGIAQALTTRGCRVVIADLRADHIATALATFAGGERSNLVSAIELDVTNRQSYLEAAEQMSGQGGVDILINNAGVGCEGPIEKAAWVDWDFGLGVNVGGVVNGVQCFLPQMLAHGRGGQIVNTASLAATVRMPGDYIIYAAGKAAVLNLSENLRAALAPKGIGVSVLLPGFVKSNIHEAAANRPAHLRAGSGFAESENILAQRVPGDNWMDPARVGEMVADGIVADAEYIVTHGEFRNRMRERFDDMMAAVPEAAIQF